MERFVEMASGAATVFTLAVADRCGLLAVLADGIPRTRQEVAEAGDLDPRYTEEILHQLTAAAVLEYDPATENFSLTPERAAVIADDTSPYSMAGWLDMLPTAAVVVDEVAEAARRGGGVPPGAYPDRMVTGIDRANSPGMRILLARRWLPAMPAVVAKLEAGARVADVGCGSGTAVLTMAQAYPNSTVFGYDLDPRAIEVAKSRAEGHDNARFEERSIEEIPLDPGFDLITSFDVIHDLAQPLQALQRIRQALAPDGVFLMMEPAVEPRLEDNRHAGAALQYGVSLLYCMTQSLAQGGAGLGAAWGPVAAEELCREAGFGSFRRLEIDNPFSAFFEVRP